MTMRDFTSPLWPIRYKPLPDELLTSWLVRLAYGHGLKVQTFCNLIFGNRHQVWNRDVDRLAPEWLVDELSQRTGIPLAVAYGTTLRSYEGRLFPKFKSSGVLLWLQTLKMYHRKREGYGVQFCGACLAEDSLPYFRKAWRVSFNTICIKHNRMLHDRCPQCGVAVMFHRMEMGRGSAFEAGSMATCHECSCDLRESPLSPIISYDTGATAWHARLCRSVVDGVDAGDADVNVGVMRVMHQLSTLLTTRFQNRGLRQYICNQLGAEDIALHPGLMPIETRPLVERHHMMQLVAWLMADLEPRLREAWRAKAVRYNRMTKDFDDAPQFYAEIVEGFSNWRA